MYNRAQLSVLKSRMAEPRRTIHVVMGPRQVGKSTMIDQFVEKATVPYSLFSADGVGKTNTAWISEKWHEVRTRMMLYNETEHILIIDEIQKIIGWSEIVKKEWDKDTMEKRNLKVILLGSSRLLIQKGLEESLEGRYEALKMGYWEWEEMREAFGFTMEQFIYFGGFPGLAPYPQPTSSTSGVRDRQHLFRTGDIPHQDAGGCQQRYSSDNQFIPQDPRRDDAYQASPEV